jgi:hypothetical protein
MSHFLRFVFCAMGAIVGLLAVFGSIFGKKFYFARPGGTLNGRQAPGWYARPFLFVFGVGAIWISVDTWLQP